MAVSNVKRLIIEFDTDADGPRGSVSVPDGSSTPFDGWLQLLAALEQLVAATPVGEAPHDADVESEDAIR